MADNDFDRACRYLAKVDPSGFAAWVLRLRLTSLRFVRWLDTRTIPFPGSPDRICDTVAFLEEVDAGGRPWAIPFEFQVEPDPEMFGRFLEYLGRLWRSDWPSPERGDRFWLGAVVVNLTGNGQCSRKMEWPAAGLTTHLGVAERNVTAESAAETLAAIAAGEVAKIVLAIVPLMQGGDEPGIIEEWKRLAEAEPNATRRSEYGGLAMVLADAAGRAAIWKQALKEWNVIRSKIVDEWRAEGRAEGEAKGRTEGRTEGRTTTIVAFLEARYKSIPADLIQAIHSTIDEERLAKLVMLTATANSLEHFRTEAGL